MFVVSSSLRRSATTLSLCFWRKDNSFRFFPIHSSLTEISTIRTLLESSKKSIKLPFTIFRATRMPPSRSGVTILSAPMRSRMDVIVAFLDFARINGTPASFVAIMVIMLASRQLVIVTMTPSIFESPSVSKACSSVVSTCTAIVTCGAISLTRSSSLSMAMTSAPAAISSSATLRPNSPSPNTAYDFLLSCFFII